MYKCQKSVVLSMESIKIKNDSIWPYVYNKTLVIFSICDTCGSSNDKIFKEKSIKASRILGIIRNMNE